MSNKKIRNATVTKQDRITFKSRLEKCFYNTLIDCGLNPMYEPRTITVWEGFKPSILFFDKETDSQYKKRLELTDLHSPRMLIPKMSTIQPIRYTPDFYIRCKNIDAWIEAKSIENDCFYIKKKLFRKYLEDLYNKTGQKSLYFEVYTKKQLLQAVQIIKDYAEENG